MSVDCWFGNDTTAATKKWQSAHGLYPDGVVGNATFGAASSHLVMDSGQHFAIYNGMLKSEYFDRAARYYYVDNGHGNQIAYYNSASACG
ncbi:peptidoglycan-binding domain-containing protein [Streptomyces sp. H10-C2]|uniref:peptidoglycan-binding domain-containing protein n=1 Tax=unclassified Streptomyces TaxID=2593676 RepID=UPI0024B98C45|nr:MULTISPECIES: peptidoglycan-binding domain-containing protein [unclassified Streptomyces]MDJ0340977.1 peptidoglycan-binding domain-containing protein [Streptomyces sp. PH10-H1]MDJ0369791.1 peptidoglycan-binding domain-containing protein [Streptomyces sp. H10-C2]